jgi:hypothetical protein
MELDNILSNYKNYPIHNPIAARAPPTIKAPLPGS